MQLEIKIVIDFGDDGPANTSIIEGNVADHLRRGDTNGYYVAGTRDDIKSLAYSMGWTSSGDDEE
jgi:hypothetical protein